MRKLLLILLAVGTAEAHKATELYIPIGQSPGLSGRVTIVGPCTAVEPKDHAVTVRARDTAWTGRITEQTRIFLDRSKLRLPNRYGTLADLKSGRRMEVKYREDQRKSGGVCEWIKVEIATPAEAGK